MKIRTGFVSNSSSSSFIVGIKNGQTKITVPIEIDLQKYKRTIIKTKEELKEYITDQYELSEPYALDLYEKALESVNNGETILIGDFSSDGGDPLESFLCNNGIPETDSITIIQNEAGY